MTLHKEGRATIIISAVLLLIINGLAYTFLYDQYPVVFLCILFVTLILFGLILFFFRIPDRRFVYDEHAVLAPCDGRVVVVEAVQPDEYFTDRRIQVSIFMSPLNVHVNLNPVDGEVVYDVYHKGKYLVAWHPKSSTLNERHTNVLRSGEKEILIKQIAGAMAKRIVNYNKPGKPVKQAAELGFIKFGSRVDLLLPMDAVIKVKIGDKAVAGVTTIATW